jgi:hypothetical protein
MLQGGRTDLVYQHPFTEISTAKRASEGLVLTEWKKLPAKPQDIDSVFRKAREQSKKYAGGVLGGTELTSVRYAVVVSERAIAVPDNVSDGDVIYRHINIAVDPLVPSKG